MPMPSSGTSMILDWRNIDEIPSQFSCLVGEFAAYIRSPTVQFLQRSNFCFHDRRPAKAWATRTENGKTVVLFSWSDGRRTRYDQVSDPVRCSTRSLFAIRSLAVRCRPLATSSGVISTVSCSRRSKIQVPSRACPRRRSGRS